MSCVISLWRGHSQELSVVKNASESPLFGPRKTKSEWSIINVKNGLNYSWKSSFVPSWLWRRLQWEEVVKLKYMLLICLRLCLFIWFRLLCVILVFSNQGQRYLRVRLAVPLLGSVACLRRMVADEGKLSPDQVNKAAIYSIPKGKSRPFNRSEGVTLKSVFKTTL